MIRGVAKTRCFFVNDTATTEIYTLSLHDALPIYYNPTLGKWVCHNLHIPFPLHGGRGRDGGQWISADRASNRELHHQIALRSEEHTSELQSRQYLVCRLLLEKKTSISILLHTTDT